MPWAGLNMIARSGSVDRWALQWMETSEFFKALLQGGAGPSDVVLDLGAHIGSFGILAASRTGCRIVAFEPEQQSLAICKANAVLNNLESNFRFFNAAVGASSGRVRLYETTENWGHTVLTGGGPANVLTGKSWEVDCYGLADALAVLPSEECAFLKFNIEGAEADFFNLADDAVLRRIRTMAGEIHCGLLQERAQELVSRIRSAGFQISLFVDAEGCTLLVARRL